MDFEPNSPVPTTEEIPDRSQSEPQENQPPRRRWKNAWWAIAVLITYLVGLGSGYGLWGMKADDDPEHTAGTDMAAIAEQVTPADGIILPVTFGNLGTQMVAAGVIDRAMFIKVYDQAGQPLTEEQLSMLDGTFTGNVVMNRTNAYFLLNFLWALGLSSQNPILDSGPIQQNGASGVENLASTGGWTLSTRPVGEVFSSLRMISLSDEQQKLVETAAEAIFRPCCDNPTNMPDCNHGMAMLGFLELMASQGVPLQEMLEAARGLNAYWFQQQAVEQAVYFLRAEGTAYQDVDPAILLGRNYSSRTGFSGMHQFLGQKGWLPQSANSGGGCGV